MHSQVTGVCQLIISGFEARALHELWANRSDLALFEVEQALWFEAVGSQRVLGRAWEKGIGSQRFG